MSTPLKQKGKNGVNFLEHFPENVLRPYGLETKVGCGSEEDFKYRQVTNISSQWLSIR